MRVEQLRAQEFTRNLKSYRCSGSPRFKNLYSYLPTHRPKRDLARLGSVRGSRLGSRRVEERYEDTTCPRQWRLGTLRVSYTFASGWARPQEFLHSMSIDRGLQQGSES